MPLSPRDILAKTFAKGFWGYKKDEVDFFLSQISQGVDDLRRDCDRLKLELSESENRIDKFREDSSSVKETLGLAREKAELIVTKGQETAESIVLSAEEEAQKLLNGYQAEINRRKSILYEITDLATNYRKKFQRMIEKTITSMDDFESSLDYRKTEKIAKSISDEEKVENPVAERQWGKSTQNFKKREDNV